MYSVIRGGSKALLFRRRPNVFSPLCQPSPLPSLLAKSIGNVRHFSQNSTNPDDNKPKGIVKSTVESIGNAIRNPRATWNSIVEEAKHYWMGSKLLWAEFTLAWNILNRLSKGHLMTRRERIHLVRTANDIFRLVPFSVFVIVPFMELLLPFALKLFPNMLPSTFQDNLKKEENLKKELQMRLAIAGFFQETLKEMVSKKGGSNLKDESGATEVINFIDKARLGEPIPNESIIRIARLFKDELTLDNIARPQLVSICQYMGLAPYGADAFLRFQIRNKIRAIKEDDRRILWEGIDSLTIEELQEACQERGMRSIGLTHFGYKRQLKEWLDLSIQKNIPMSLLIISRAFSLKSTSSLSEDVLKSSISSLTDDTINEVVIAAASSSEENSLDIRKRKLESLQFQSELILEEREEANEAIQAKSKKAMEAKSQSTDAFALQSEAHAMPDMAQDKLSIHEVEVLGDLARGSSVVREKAQLAQLQAHIETVNLSDHSHQHGEIDDLPTEIPSGADANIDKHSAKAIQDVHNVLNSMLDKLKVKIDTTEKELGDKLNVLDKDGDGELSSDELKEAIRKILKRANTDEEAEEMVRILDRDSDGKVSVTELLRYVESRKNKIEIEALEKQLSKDSK